ncbi:MAG: hypothetical protein A2493_01060 [Candidatus Magasanikbacteria bacterium RIFOXYC12_FULL_33_11]|uniref:Mur ligase central domain-containing protein n=1 Tax=Candidatus Magasanikbacteria bacterium RIFOXYC12_FULL_33_11 TaxID=1798701 RepID=A0A1F6NRI9_9BACT|nr:MAG: hypothetical protein A2493_01060 [Candidatus Magasanikbacteria bacterium RIFOXYC12_FULL_33_11]
MWNILDIAIIFFWFISMTNEYLQYAYFWQLKEYRWDRFLDLLRTNEGKRIIFRYDFFYKIPLILVVFFWDQRLDVIKLVVLLIYVLDFLYLLSKIVLKKPIKKPKFSLKIILILFLAIFMEAAFFEETKDIKTIATFSFLRFMGITIIVYLMNIISQLVKDYIARMATKKMMHYKKMRVIGITGSYGKTTTKEILSQLLSHKFKVIKTPKNINTDIGISRFILKTSFKDVDYFVVEMGAYSIGEINKICNIVKPEIGILTAISPQHLSLFGSIENIQTAKYELLRSLPKNGLAITNSDNKYCREFLADLKSKVLTFGFDEEYNPNCLVKDMKETDTGIRCKLIRNIDSEKLEVELQTKLFGDYNISNLQPSLLTATHLGFNIDEIKEALKRIESPGNALRVQKYGEALLLNDTYNSNPDGFRAAINALSRYSHSYKKVIITRGILELGELSDEIHEQIGGEIAFVADELVIIAPDFVIPLKKGVGTKYQTNVIIQYNYKEILAYIQKLKNEKTVILLENKMPQIVKEEIEKNT